MFKLLIQNFSNFENDGLTGSDFCDSPLFLFYFEASPRRDVLSNFLILFPGPCPAGCFFSLVVTNFSPSNFCLMLLPYTRMYVLAFRGFVSACVFRSSSSGARDTVVVCLCGFVYTHLRAPFPRCACLSKKRKNTHLRSPVHLLAVPFS